MKNGKLSSILTAAAIFCGMFGGISTALAQEITAIDFNGDLIGKVIPDGKVVSFENQLIGNITADSLIVNFDGDLIGGVVPRGVAIGNDNRLLGKVSNDGTVRLSSGKIVGKALPNGLVVDDKFAVIGAVLFPGLIYSDEGKTIGRLTGDGAYANLQGQTIGFVSSDGYAYRRSGNDYTLDGRLISSKMVISATGDFIGSVTPGGRVSDSDGKIIGAIKANGFAYNDSDKIIGRIVKTGYAFDIKGNYIGFVSYNGEVVNKGKVIGRLQIDGSIADSENKIIGFMTDIAAVATNANGRYLGRIMPEGKIAQGRNIIGKIGPWQRVFSAEGQPLGRVAAGGPVFDYKGNLLAHALKNGQVISLSGAPYGFMRGNYAFDNNGRLTGGVLREQLVISANNAALGMLGIGSFFRSGDDIKYVSPFGYVYNADGNIDGNLLSPGQVYGLSGNELALLYPDGRIMNRGSVAPGRITQYGWNIDDKNMVLGGQVAADYAVNSTGESLGILADGNLVLDSKLAEIGKILPDSSVVEAGKDKTALMPLAGKASTSALAMSLNGRLLGYVNDSGQIKDLSGLTLGKVSAAGVALDNGGAVIGGSREFAPVVSSGCEFVGVVTPSGDVRNYREVNLGRLLPNRQVVSESGAVIGFAVASGSVIDYSGNNIGSVSSNGRVLNFADENLGCIDWRGRLYNANRVLVGHQVEIAPVMNFNHKIIGRSMADGTVINNSGKVIGYIRPDNVANSKTGQPLGALFKYRFAFGNNNQLIGLVNEKAEVYNSAKTKVGEVDYNGNVVNRGKKIGYALYDLYIYDNDNNVMGYITTDGNVMSFGNQNLGKLVRGFLVVPGQNKANGRGNRNYYITDNLRIVIGELRMDGTVYSANNELVGTLGIAGDILASDGQVIATADPLQYYEAEKKQPVYDQNGNVIGYAGDDNSILDEKGNVIGQLNKDGSAISVDGSVIGNTKLGWYQKPEPSNVKLPQIGSVTVDTADSAQYKKSLNIALTPDGEYLGDILEDGSVIDKIGNVVGKLLPDGLVVDAEGSLIGIEEAAKKSDKTEMFVPAGTFGQGGAYGTGSGANNLGPGGGYGPGERYDSQRSAALATAQNQRRQNMQVGKISSGVRREAFDGMQKNWDEQGIAKAVSSWRVDMSEMIFADKPIPAVIARSIDSSNPAPITAYVERNVYAESGRNVIIPAGSRLMGTLGGVSASTETSSESAKVQISWERLVRPDGVTFVFQGLTGDAQGRGGALGYLDQQLFKKYTLPLATVLMTSASSYLLAAPDKNSGTETESSRQQAANDARQNFLDQMNQIFQMILNDKTNIRPLTYIPAGTRIIVYPNVDLWMRTAERDAEVSTNDQVKDVLIDDKKTQDEIASRAVDRRAKLQTASSANVVYEAEKTKAQPVLISDKSEKQQQSAAVTGATPPPPPSNNTRRPSGSGSGSSDVPQLF